MPRILGSPAYRRDGAVIITFSLPDRSARPGTVPSTGSASTGALVLSRHAGRGNIVSSADTPYSGLSTCGTSR